MGRAHFFTGIRGGALSPQADNQTGRHRCRVGTDPGRGRAGTCRRRHGAGQTGAHIFTGTPRHSPTNQATEKTGRTSGRKG